MTETIEIPDGPPRGLLAGIGALADWSDIEMEMAAVVAARPAQPERDVLPLDTRS